jgi:pimeloyl-ACP methyl ester carboxylesterase
VRCRKLAALFAVAAGAASAQNIAGDWVGSLKNNVVELRFLLHLKQDANGAWSATLDSIDQGVKGIAAESVTFQNSKLTVTAAGMDAKYEGKVMPGGAIQGTWTQTGDRLPLTFQRATAEFLQSLPKPAPPTDIDGAWIGYLDLGPAPVKPRIIFHFANMTTGLTALMDSLDQNVSGLPATVTRKGPALTVTIPAARAVFDGKVAPDHSAITGTLTQNGEKMPLSLAKTDEAELKNRRPQDPIRPYPYKEVEVTYENTFAGVKLAGTLTIPQGKGPYPAAILITDSGPQDRDEATMGHRPFLVLADYLTRRGIAVLRSDDRGMGKSTGSFATATTVDFSVDVEAAVALLKKRPEINPHRIGLIGHGEGALEAPMVAVHDPDVAFVVMLAGSGVRGDGILVEQARLAAQNAGQHGTAVEKAAADYRAMLTAIETEKDEAALRKQLREMLKGKVPDAQMDESIGQLLSPWYRFFLSYDPLPWLQQMRCPVLALTGGKDTLVTPAMNLPPMRKALAGNKNAEVAEMPGLNHMFQTADRGSMDDYGNNQETLAPALMERITAWIGRMK